MISLRSKITQAVLNYFYLHEDEDMYVNELQRALSLDKRNLVKKLQALQNEGILQSQTRGNMRIYSLNKKYPLLNEYKKIVFKQAGFERQIAEMIRSVPGAKTAIIFGSYAQGNMDEKSDMDLLVIGSHSVLEVQRKVNAIQKKIQREVNVINMDEKEYLERQKKSDGFISRILKSKHIRIDA